MKNTSYNAEVFFPSIFNDVLAPVTPGPSSSNTVGPWRIGALARRLLGEAPVYLKAEMSKSGGFADTFYSMGSDKGFLAGLLGQELLTAKLDAIYELAEQAGLKYEFSFTDRIARLPSEMAELTIKSENETLSLRGISLGGGEVLIDEINGHSCQIDGRHKQVLVIPGSGRSCELDSIYPLHTLESPEPPFTSSEGMLRYVRERGISLWEAALDYEQSLTGESKETIWKLAQSSLETAYASIEAGKSATLSFEGITSAKTAAISERKAQLPQIPMGAADSGSLEALAVMEYAAAHGRIVCMPTGGASGIVPAAIKATAEKTDKCRDDEVRALLTAGLVGVFYYPTHYHGALGCQAEVGVASSMAAAGIAEMVSASPEAAEAAAVLAMQCLIGQVCDPIEGYTQIPCFVRNVAAVPLAMCCANYGILGLDAGVSLDEMAKAMLRVGEKIREYRISDCGTCMCSRTAEQILV